MQFILKGAVINTPSLIENLKEFFDEFLYEGGYQKILIGALILFLFLGLKHLISKVFIDVFVKKFTKKTKTDIDDRIVEAIQKPIELLIVVIGAFLASSVIQFDPAASNFINHVLRSLIVFSFFWGTYRVSEQMAEIFAALANKSETKIDDVLSSFLKNALKVVIIVFGIITIIQEWGYDINGLIAGLGLGGLAFALAAQDTVGNLFGSIAVMIDKTFTIGDWIQASGVEGTVEEIGFRVTKIRQFDQGLVSVPNSVMSNGPIVNFSKRGKRRITFQLGVEYRTTRSQIEKTVLDLKNMLENHNEIHEETVFVFFDNFGNSSLNIFIYFFTKTTVWEEHLRAKEDINLKIISILEENGVSCAFPSTSLYIEEDKTK